MTCTEMSGNGVRISGMITMMLLLQTVVLGKVEAALTVLSGAAAGATSPGAAVQLAASGSTPTTTTASVSAS